MPTRLRLVALLFLSLSGATACGTYTDPILGPTASAFTNSVSFVSRIQERGSAWRSFTMTAGDISVQLVSVSQGAVVMGLGLGTVNGTECVLTKSVQTTPNNSAVAPQISATLPLGTYCVKIWDIGNLTSLADFAIAITFPS